MKYGSKEVRYLDHAIFSIAASICFWAIFSCSIQHNANAKFADIPFKTIGANSSGLAVAIATFGLFKGGIRSLLIDTVILLAVFGILLLTLSSLDNWPIKFVTWSVASLLLSALLFFVDRTLIKKAKNSI